MTQFNINYAGSWLDDKSKTSKDQNSNIRSKTTKTSGCYNVVMAKCRFPGKALKLNARKRIKFNWDSEKNPDELRVLQIKSGLLLFRHLFGDSEEEDDFSGFVTTDPSRDVKGCNTSHFDNKKNGNKGQPSQKAKFKNFTKAFEDEGEKKEKLLNDQLSLLVSSTGERRSLRGINKGHKLDQFNNEPIVISKTNEDSNNDELRERMTIKRKKLLPKESEKVKKFVLPTISAHSSRVIKPNMRIFSDMTTLGCTNSTAVSDELSETTNKFPFPLNPPAKLTIQNVRSDSPEFDERAEKDPVCRSITLYTDAITEQFKGPVARGRKPKKFVRQVEAQGQDELIVASESLSPSPIRGAKEEKVKEKIEKLLRSPWDERLKQNTTLLVPAKEPDASVSKTILRKARLNLNNRTLQKLRSPSLLQHLISASDTGSKSRKCGLCQIPTFKSVACYGVSCCETCQLTMNCFIEGTFSSLVCQGGQGECQLVGLSPKERCEACWLSKILATCAMPNLLHDNLRKQLPSIIREKVPTSLGRSFNVNSVVLPQRDGNDSERGRHFSAEEQSSCSFGSLIDLPGGWKRKCGNEVIVISPTGEKFRSLSKLEEYLNHQGIKAEAAVLFGTLKQNKNDLIEDPKHESKFYKKSNSKLNNVVVTTLPGGWSRRIKWRYSGDKFDTYVCSPDGRIFRSRKDLSSYFQRIGKVDDMNKYFPVKSSPHSYSENSEASTTEPFSEASSEVNTDKSAAESESDTEVTESMADDRVNDENDLSHSKKSCSKSSISNDINLSSSVIISNFANSIVIKSSNAAMDMSEDHSINNVNLDKDDAISVSSMDGSFQGDSSAIDLNFLSEGKNDDGFSFKYKTFEELESEKIDISIPNTFSNSDMLDLFKDRSKHKHKKHKKKKKKHHSSSRKHESDNETDKRLHKNKGSTDNETETHHKNNKSDIVDLKYHAQKKSDSDIDSIKIRYNKENKDKSVITNDCHSLVTLERQGPNKGVKVVGVDEFVCSTIDNANVATEYGVNHKNFNSVSVLKDIDTSVISSSSINITTYHPNDTWSTLVNPSEVNAQQPSLHVASNEMLNDTDKDSIAVLEGNHAALSMQAPLKLKIKTRAKILKSNFTKEQFGNGWHRKIRWNNEGQGKVAFLTSPEGQKIVSSIELLAYFKKAGKPFPNLEFYFPQNLVKDLPNDNIQENEDIVEGNLTTIENNSNPYKCRRINNKLSGKLERGRGRKVLYKLPRSKFGKRALKHLNSTLEPNELLNIVEKEHIINKNTDKLEETATHVDGGPRVKHVCRSQAQVLGMPRAVFPSPDGKSTCKKTIFSEKKQKQYLAVVTPKGKRILKKTIWCHKCPGCTTPNCKICSNCLDMKKYGGPGTKKKPCIMRKCQNPFKAIKVSVTKENLSSVEGEINERETGEKNETSSKKGDSDVLSIKLSSLQTSDSDVLDEVESIDISCSILHDENYKSAEKSIFIPKLLNRHINEVKDRVDILQGKEFIPGARVNIDYWQDYDAEEMLINGFPIITSLPLDLESLCFRCGSGGLEEMLYCIWCCEGVHPFCLEEGEGPESDEQETLWVCKKCTVCHVCGAPNDLMQCSDCRRHFHIECLGPLSHISCHTASDGSWKTEAMKLLSFSVPRQAPLIDVGECELNLASVDEVSAYLYEQLERFKDERVLRPSTYFLPTSSSSWQHPELFFSPDKHRKRDVFIESVFIEDTPEDLEEEGGFCLEDEFEGFSDLLPFVDVGIKEDAIDLYTGIDLYTDLVPSEREEKLCERIGMDAEEYLALGYSKIIPFKECHTDFSWYKLLRMIHFELFTVLNYPTWKQMRKKGQVTCASWKVPKRKCSAVKKYCARCVKCEGCGNPNVLEWIAVCRGENDLGSPINVAESRLAPFCYRCIELRHSNNYCPICFGCYEDDDFESKMMECGHCKEWIHSHCEGLSDECYQILSYLPDSVEYICRICLKGSSSHWMEAVKKELKNGIQTILTALMNCKYAKHLLRLEIPAIARKPHLSPSSMSPMILENISVTPVFKQCSSEFNSCIMSKLDNSEKVSPSNCLKTIEVNQVSHSPPIASNIPVHSLHENETTLSLENGSSATQMESEPVSNSSQTIEFLGNVESTELGTTMQTQNFYNLSFKPEDMVKDKDFGGNLRESVIPSSSASSVTATVTSIDSLLNFPHADAILTSQENCLPSNILPFGTQVVLNEEKLNILFETKQCKEEVKRGNTHSLSNLNDTALNYNSIVSTEPLIKRRLTRSVTSTLKDKETELKIKSCSVLLKNIASSSNNKVPETNVSSCDNSFSTNPDGSVDTVVEDMSVENDPNFKELLLRNSTKNCQIEQIIHSDLVKESVVFSSNEAEKVIPHKTEFGIATESELVKATSAESAQFSFICNTFSSSNEKLTLFQHGNDNQSLCLSNETLLKEPLCQSHNLIVSNQASINMPWLNNSTCGNEFLKNGVNEPGSLFNSNETKSLHKNEAGIVKVENVKSNLNIANDSIVPNPASAGVEKEILLITKNDRKGKFENNASLNVPIHVARVCKDIDDDCLSSEASSICGSDTEIESIFEDSEEARDLLDIKDRLYKEKYESILQFHIDIMGVFESGKNVNKSQTRMCRTTYIKLMKDSFAWFNVHKPNIFSLINSSRPFPYPSADHIYADLKPNGKTISSSNSQHLAVDPVCSSVNGNDLSFQNSLTLLATDLRKCVLCNVSGDKDPEECGRLLYLGQDEWLHVNCGLWSSEVYEEEDGGLINVYVALTRGRHIKCSLCGERGATVGCCHKSCQATYHFMCARKNNSFFGSDKRIFCNLHIASAGHQSPIEDLRVRRCVFVNMDSEKKRWRQVFSDKVNVIIGSLAIKQLGKMVPDLESDDALIPLDYCCTRLYWSTKDPTTRVVYTCRTKRINPCQYSADGINDFGFHKTIDHELEGQIVEREMKLVRKWQNEMDRQQLAIQSRHTNIIPPHMCPLYRNILREERRKETNSTFGNSVCARRKLFSPTPSNSSSADDDDVRLCLENIIAQITHSQETDSTSSNSQKDVVEDNELIAMVSADESNELMSNIVSADDNEIISMVLRDLPVIESSAPHSPPSSGRASPLNLDFLTSYEQAVNLQDLHQKSHLDDKIEDFQCQTEFSVLHNGEKDFEVDAEPEANLCQKIFDACDPQVQSQLLTMEQAHINTHCNNSDMQSLVASQPFNEASSLMAGDHDALVKSVSNMFTDVILPTESRFNVECVGQPPVASSYDNQFLSDFDQGSMLAYSTLSENHSTHNEKLSLMGTNYCDTQHGSSALSSCSNEFLELNNFLMDAAKSCNVNPKSDSFFEPTSELTNCVSSNCHITRPIDLQDTTNVPFMPLSSIVNGLLDLEAKNEITQIKKLGCSYELEGHSSSNERSTENSSQESPFSALLPSSSTSSTPSVSSKKQVCRVLPMPSTESRRPSSASEQSDTAVISLSDTQGATNIIPRVKESCEDTSNISQLPKGSSSVPKKKGKIHMKRNYRTVIKKYPLRSSLRKHSSFKSVQIEINETIEIPSDDDDDEAESKVKRKWSSTILDSNSADSQHDDVNVSSGSKQHRKRVFRASVSNAAKVEPSEETPHEDKLKESHSQDKAKSEASSSRPRSHQVLKFSDDHNDITVSIVNNNNLGLCDFSKRKRRHRFRRKTVLQLDGAADESTSSSEESDNECLRPVKPQELLQSNLALHIKQQSLARSTPGEEGPYKCAKCKRLYRTKDSYSRHIETCTFEIDSSSQTDEDSENNSNDSIDSFSTNAEVQLKHTIKTYDNLEQCNLKDGNPSSFRESFHMATLSKDSNTTDIEKLQDFCSLPLLEQKLCDKTIKQEPDSEKSRSHGLHRQVRIAKRKESENTDSKFSVCKSSPTSTNSCTPSTTNEVFVPPSKSPIKFSPTFKKSASPRKYTNVRLSKGKGYQYRRAASQMVAQNIHQLHPQVQGNMYQLQASNLTQQQQIQQTNLPVNIQSFIEPNTYNIQNAFSAQSFTNPMHHFTSLNGNIGVQNTMAQLGQVVTMVSGPSVAVPQGYTLQYVGSYRDGDMGASATNLLTYQAPQSVVMPQIVMASQNSPLVMPSVVNANFTYAIAAPETLVINQPQAIVPNLQYITQPPTQTFQQQIVQPINNAIVPIAPSPMPTVTNMTPSFSMPVHTNALTVQHIGTSATNLSLPYYSASNLSSSVLMSTASETFRSKPQAFIAPITSSSSSLPSFTVESSLPVRPIFSQLPPVSRSVATVAPAMYTSSASIVTKTHINDSSGNQNIEPAFTCDFGDNEDQATVRPRPTYSYRDAMMDVGQEKKRLKTDTVIEAQEDPMSGHERKIAEEESESDKEVLKSADKKETKMEKTYKLILKKDCHSSTKFNFIPVNMPNIGLATPEVKELRIKAKVSVGPKRKKNDGVHRQWGQYGKDFIIGSSDITNELSVNEQVPNLKLNFSPNTSPIDDPTLMDKPKTANPEPYIVFELTSDDGFKVESRHVTEVWQKVFDAVSEARENLRVGGAAPIEKKGKSLSGLYMLGLTHNAVQYLLEQLPGAKDCHKYSFQFHRRPAEDEEELASASGCARTESFKVRSPYDIFSWLASKHRKLPHCSQVQQEEIQLSTRRATSMDLPMAMRYRHLCETAREAVGVFRSLIHGRGLFCKREIDSGEMVIEYAGQVIRSCLCDMREKFYESKGIGCYMFRIDEDTVIDATMHGNAARFINHSCDPNCFSRVVDILGKKHIIIFALRRIVRGEELTYDYKFPIEDDKIPCSCGARKCRKYLN